MQYKVERIWFIAFESKGIYKVGGLGEVAGSMTKALTSKNLKVALIMPSHGVIKNEKTREKIRLSEVEAFSSEVLGKEYKIAIYKGLLDSVELYVISGANEEAEKVLENPVVYADGITEPKAALLARSMSVLYDIGNWKPDIVHINDWHAVPSGMALKLYGQKIKSSIPLLFQIHLYCGKWVDRKYLSDFCGLDLRAKLRVHLNGEFKEYTLEQLYLLSEGILERLAAYISDVVATVSESYLKKDENNILRNIGFQFENKSTYIYNGCDWRLEEILDNVLERHREGIEEYLGVEADHADRKLLRKYFLEKALGELPENEPIIKDEYLARLIKELKGPIANDVGKPLPFEEDGPLIITTGRTSVQKGFDVLMKAIPHILKIYPTAKFLFLLLPVRGGESLVKELFTEACKYPRNVRVIFGITPSIYHLAHIAATLYAAPSRWEPFGIMALESMAVGTPVVASRVGGLSETILDLKEHGIEGTGFLVPKDSIEDLARAIISLISLMEEKADNVLYQELKKLACTGVSIRIRNNCIRRVEENFRWIKVADMAINAYNNALLKAQG
ncbi:MAG: hypothetical protein DRJ38_02785 [Thermoprotei archaeon]|nr:MAG: hypothetical protein DRJ38_02785 [Thermoprotei archaeon]